MKFSDAFRGLQVIRRKNADGIAASAIATIDLPVAGPTYYELRLVCRDSAGDLLTKAEIIADITNIAVEVAGPAGASGKLIDLADTDLIAVEDFYETGVVPTSGDIVGLPIKLHRPWMEFPDNQDAVRWGTQDLTSMQVQITMAGTVSNIATIECFSLVNLSEPQPLGRHIRLVRHSRSAPGAGEEIIQTPWKPEPGKRLLACHWNKATITHLEVRSSGQVYDKAPIELLNALGFSAARTVQSGYTHLDFMPRNRVIDSMPLVDGDFQIRATWSSDPGAHILITEELHGDQVA